VILVEDRVRQWCPSSPEFDRHFDIEAEALGGWGRLAS
jgi:hypothetical protein